MRVNKDKGLIQGAYQSARFRMRYVDRLFNSLFKHGLFIELKDFKSKLYSKNGLPTKSLQKAKKQIDDWREWIRINEPYLRKRFSAILKKFFFFQCYGF